MNKRKTTLFFVVIFILLTAVAGYTSGSAALSQPAPLVEPDQPAEIARLSRAPASSHSLQAGETVPPFVLSTSPEPGAELPLDAPIEITFGQPMDRPSVERAFAIEPGASVDGTFEWLDDQTIRFIPAGGLQRGERYRVRVVAAAESQAGVPMQRPFELRFNTVGYLEVANVQPQPGATEVGVDGPITVMFNRPVVPLGALEAAGSLPDPLTFVPPVQGEGEWLNTAAYQFTPTDEFQPATAYTARVSQGLTDVTGQAILEDDYEWTFNTISPAVAASVPLPGDLYVSPTPVISVAFNQMMDRQSVEQNLQLIAEATGDPVPGRFNWVERGIMPPPAGQEGPGFYDPGQQPLVEPEPVGAETVEFTPTRPLDPAAAYRLVLPPGVESSLGAETQNAYEAAFTVIPDPEVVSTNPPAGEQFADIWQGLEVTFNAPMNPESVVLGQNLIIEPETIAATDVYTYWSENNTIFTVSFPRRENSVYTVTLEADIEGRYGQPLGQDVVINWKTLRQSPYVYLVSPKIGLYNGYQDQTYVYMTVRNVSQVHFDLYHLPAQDFLSLAQDSYRGWESANWTDYRPDAGDLIGRWQQTTDPETFVNYVYKVDMSEAVAAGEALEPGLYYLEAYAESEDFYDEARVNDPEEAIDRQILIVSRNNLTLKQGDGDLLAWLTDLQTGQPVADVPLAVFGANGDLTGATGPEGVAAFTYEPPANMPDPTLFVFAGDPDQPGSDFTVGSTAWSAGIAPFDFDYLYGAGSLQYGRRFVGHVYTDRNIYRPGQTIYFKGIVRRDNDARYTIPTGESVEVTIYDAQYREIYREQLSLNEMGTYNGSLVLDEDASLGGYQVQANVVGLEDDYFGVGFHTFNVAEYRRPEFLVEAVTGRPEYKAGETIELTVNAEYFFGGPVANADVRWTLLSDPYYFNYQGRGYYDFTNEDNSRANIFNPNFGFGFGEQIASGTGQTDASGRFTLELPADLTGRRTSQTFTFDVAVIGLNDQEVAAQLRTVVHKGDFYIGLRAEQYVGQISQPQTVELLVVDPDSRPVANQEVELVVTRENWYSVQQLDVEASRTSPDDQFYWENIVENEAIFTTTVTTDDEGLATASFTPDQGGTYKIYARAVDSEGRDLFSSTFLWVTGYQFVNWGQENNDRIELVAGQPEYSTGDTAAILVPHPYTGPVRALVTLERGRIYDHFVAELESNSEQIEIPITEEMSPNIYVSVVIIKGMEPDDDPSTITEAELPGFKIGYARLNVNQAEKQLNITLTPTTPPTEAGYYLPDQTVEYDIKVTDFEGQPVEAELSLALIDKAILTLAPERAGQLLSSFWTRRALEVQTSLGLTLALDRINRALDERKGGGGGDGGPGLDSVRQNFADVPLWIPDLKTDENGEAAIEARLPDNLTTWVLIAKGVTAGDTLVGEAQNEIVASKPLLVRPVTPRFLVVGDEAQLGLIVQNNSQESLDVEAAFEANGLEIGDWRIGTTGDWQDAAETPELTVGAGEEVRLEYQTTVADVEQVELTMGVESAQLDDAVAFQLPVYRLSAPETVATLGVLEADGTRLEGIALPASFDPDQGGLTVQIEPSLAAGMEAGLAYLEHYPYESVEQVVSRFLPNIFTYRALQELALDKPELEQNLPRLVNTGIQRLNSMQNFDGGWGWWSGSESDPFLTAYALLGLVEARRADFTVEQWVVDNAVSYLQQNLMAPQDVAEPWQANRQAFILYVLAEAGQSDLSRSVTLFDRREQLDIFGRAFLAMAFHLADPEAGQIETLLADITAAAVASAAGAHWEERQIDYRAMSSDIRSTAIVIAALSRIQPDHPLLPQAVRWLMTAREQDGHWETTQETAWAIIGLTDWLRVSGELQADYAWQVSLNGRELAGGVAEEATLDQTTELQVAITDLLSDMVNRLAVERDASGAGQDELGNLYYAAYLTYFKPVEQVKAIDRGIIVYREYSLQEDEEAQPITEAEVGDFIQVKLTVIAPTDLHYVVVEDYLPAGAEALDSSLATTSLVGQPPQMSRADLDDNQRPWGWWYFTHTDLRDEKAVLFASYLPQGVYEYTYTIRASMPGEYHVIPTHARQMYFPEVFGRSDGGLFRITN